MTDKELLAYARRYVGDPDSPIHALGTPSSSMLKYNVIAEGDKLIWDNVSPLHFIHIEPLDVNSEYFQVYVNNANGKISSIDLNDHFSGYVDIFKAMLARFKNAEHATVATSFTWLQQYRLRKSVFAASPDSPDWNLYQKESFLKTGRSSSYRIVKDEALKMLYPDAKNILDNIRGLDITSLEAEELLRDTCEFSAPVRNSTTVEHVDLPENITY